MDDKSLDLIDVGINLTHDSYAADREEVIAAAYDAGVAQLIVTGATLDGSLSALELARSHAFAHSSSGRLFATAGVHPHHASELQEADLPRLRALLAQPEVVAIGECGLDYYRNFSPYAAQRHAFELQLRLALECGKPLFLHQRDAHRDFVALLRDAMKVAASEPSVLESGARVSGLHGVAHCFTGGVDELEAYLELGLHIGITGWICDERRGAHLLELVPRIPRGRILLETDGPYLLPRDLSPKPASRRNEPRYLRHIAATVARARGESLEECAAHTSGAARALFGLPMPAPGGGIKPAGAPNSPLHP